MIFLKRSLTLLGGLSLVFFTFSCVKAQVSPENKIITVKAAEVVERSVADTVSGFGSLSFTAKVDITAPQEGKIGCLYYREGDRVEAGSAAVQLVNPQISLAVQRAEDAYSQAAASFRLAKARLAEGEYTAEADILAILKAEAELAESRRTLEEERRKHKDTERLYAAGGMSTEAIRESRFSIESAEERLRLMERELEIRNVGRRDKDLAAAGLLPAGGFSSPEKRRAALVQLSTLALQAEAEAAEAQFEAAGREQESARLAFSELSVLSPVTGIVGARYMEEGERVRRDDRLLTLMDTESLYAVFTLRESDALRLRKGMRAMVNVDGTGKQYEGTVDLVSPQADSQSFTFTTRVRISAPDTEDGSGGLRPGMFARVTVHAGADRKCTVIPDQAIINKKNDEGVVFVILNGKVSERNIRFAELTGDEREVLSGLAPGEVISINPDLSLKEGSHVLAEE